MFNKIGCIQNLEVSSVCNLSCPYCPASVQSQYRSIGLMSDEIVNQSMIWLEKFVEAGTQRELNVFGIGEPFLHPKFIDILRKCREVLPMHLVLRFNTNGILLTEELLEEAIEAGANAIDLTDHDARTAMEAWQIIDKVHKKHPHIRFGYSRDAIIHPNNWGGLINWVSEVKSTGCICPWLQRGQVMIMSNGNVTRCCQDAYGRGVLGTVWDNLLEIDHTPFIQCETCHELIPSGMKLKRETPTK